MRFSRLFLAAALAALSLLPSLAKADNEPFTGWFAEQAEPEKKWGFMLFGGKMSARSFAGTLMPFNGSEYADINFVGGALNHYVGHWRYLDFEVEGGAGYQFAEGTENDSGQIWLAYYVRYDNFPWNEYIKTTIAVNTGINYAFKQTAFEESFSSSQGTKNLMHYLAPEVTFAAPGYDDFEAVFRLHHRSAVNGLFGCTNCRNNMVTFGIRGKF